MRKTLYQNRQRPTSQLAAAMLGLEIVFHSIVRNIREQHKNAFIALAVNFMQAVMLIGMFFLMFSLLGLRSSPLRGDFILFLMSGIFMFLTHIKSVQAVQGAGGGSNPLHQHAPLNTLAAVLSAALGTLYTQILVAVIVLGLYHIVWAPIFILDPLSALAMLILSWFTGCGVGFVFLALTPWIPGLVSIISQIYRRAQMIASGKMFVANTLPGFMIAMFDWNPLFHTIDQSRGYLFINYFPRNSSWEYALNVGIVLFILGLIGMFYAERSKSISWGAKG